MEETLRQKGIEAHIIGTFTGDKRRLLTIGGKETMFPEEAEDPYERSLTGQA